MKFTGDLMLKRWITDKLKILPNRWKHKKKSHETQPDEKLQLQKSYLPMGVFPSQFSLILGEAPCNHFCLFCPQSIAKPKKKIWADLDVIEKVLHELPTHNICINTASYSETMLNPVLMPALELMKRIRPNLPIVLATNGTTITESQVDRLIDVGLDMLSFSFDAADQSSYKALMQIDDFHKTELKLEMICRIRNERKSPMKILTHVMAFDNQVKAFELFRKKWEHKVDTVSFRPVSNWGDENLEIKKRLKEKGFVSIYKPPPKRYPCVSIFMHMKLNPEGLYCPCVAYVSVDSKLKGPTLGDARKIKFAQAWQNLESMRAKHLAGKWDECPYCSGCDVWGLWPDIWYKNDGHYYLNETITNINHW